jgi:hypothetical protein
MAIMTQVVVIVVMVRGHDGAAGGDNDKRIPTGEAIDVLDTTNWGSY